MEGIYSERREDGREKEVKDMEVRDGDLVRRKRQRREEGRERQVEDREVREEGDRRKERERRRDGVRK